MWLPAAAATAELSFGCFLSSHFSAGGCGGPGAPIRTPDAGFAEKAGAAALRASLAAALQKNTGADARGLPNAAVPFAPPPPLLPTVAGG
jgi:hypothetical protein